MLRIKKYLLFVWIWIIYNIFFIITSLTSRIYWSATSRHNECFFPHFKCKFIFQVETEFVVTFLYLPCYFLCTAFVFILVYTVHTFMRKTQVSRRPLLMLWKKKLTPIMPNKKQYPILNAAFHFFICSSFPNKC